MLEIGFGTLSDWILSDVLSKTVVRGASGVKIPITALAAKRPLASVLSSIETANCFTSFPFLFSLFVFFCSLSLFCNSSLNHLDCGLEANRQ